MTNEEIKKLGNYRTQMESFGLSMEDEMKGIQNEEWTGFAREIVKLSERMSASVQNKIENRG